MNDNADREPSRRIDKWLWCVRRFKTRSLAAKFVSDASVRVTRDGVTQRIDKPAYCLREGDEVSFILGERLIIMTVVAFAERRGAPALARTLFAEKGKMTPVVAAPPAPVCKAAR